MPFALKESAGSWNVHRFFVSFYSHRVNSWNVVEPLRLFHPTRVDGGAGISIDVLFRSIQHRVKL